MVQWLRRSAAALEDAGSNLAAVAAFLMEAKSNNLKYAPVVKINAEPSTTACLIAQVIIWIIQKREVETAVSSFGTAQHWSSLFHLLKPE